MGVSRDLVYRQRDLFRASGFSQSETIPLMDWQATPQIRQRERGFAVAPIRGADQLKQRFVFRDRQQLPLAKHPASGRKVAPEHSDFTDVRLGHDFLLSLRWEDSLDRDAKTQHQKRLHVQSGLAASR